jgi:hypothetical protein
VQKIQIVHKIKKSNLLLQHQPFLGLKIRWYFGQDAIIPGIDAGISDVVGEENTNL